MTLISITVADMIEMMQTLQVMFEKRGLPQRRGMGPGPPCVMHLFCPTLVTTESELPW